MSAPISRLAPLASVASTATRPAVCRVTWQEALMITPAEISTLGYQKLTHHEWALEQKITQLRQVISISEYDLKKAPTEEGKRALKSNIDLLWKVHEKAMLIKKTNPRV